MTDLDMNQKMCHCTEKHDLIRIYKTKRDQFHFEYDHSYKLIQILLEFEMYKNDNNKI